MPCDDAKASYIDVNAEIVIGLAGMLAGVFMPDALHRSRQQAEAGKFADGKIDSTRTVRHRLKRYPAHAAPIQRPPRVAALLHTHYVCRKLRHIRNRVALSRRDLGRIFGLSIP